MLNLWRFNYSGLFDSPSNFIFVLFAFFVVKAYPAL